MVPTQLFPVSHKVPELWVLWMAGTELGFIGHILNKKAPEEEASMPLHRTPPT